MRRLTLFLLLLLAPSAPAQTSAEWAGHYEFHRRLIVERVRALRRLDRRLRTDGNVNRPVLLAASTEPPWLKTFALRETADPLSDYWSRQCPERERFHSQPWPANFAHLSDLPRFRRLTVTVTAGGRPAPGVTLTLAGDYTEGLKADAAGRVVFEDLTETAYAVTPAGEGMAFGPAASEVVAGTADTTLEFIVTSAPFLPLIAVDAQGRALALDAYNWTREPFSLAVTEARVGAGQSTRVVLLVRNADPGPAILLTDSSGKEYGPAVEYSAPVVEAPGFSYVVFTLPKEAASGEAKVRVIVRGWASREALVEVRR